MLSLSQLLSMQPTDHSQFDHHGLTFFVLLIINQGEGQHNINFCDYSYEPGSVFILGPNNVQKFYASHAKGDLLVFTEDFVHQYLNEKNAARMFGLFNQHLASPKLQLNEPELIEIQNQVNSIRREFNDRQDEYSLEMIRSMLHILITQLIRVKSVGSEKFAGSAYLDQFLQFQALVEEQCLECKTVNHYAGLLSMTPRTLNNITNSVVQKSAKAVIDHILITKIKSYLINSDLNIAQVAFECGFLEPSHLTKFFKKYTRLTPSKFKNLFP